MLTAQPNGKTVEVGLIGNEGFVGVPVIFGFKTSGLRVITQGDGTAYRVDIDTLLRIRSKCPELEKQLQRFSMMMGMQSTQLAACNRLHDVVERLARWLLMSHDRIGGVASALDAGVPVTDARHSPGERDGSGRHSAKSRNDPVLSRQRGHSGSCETRSGGLRLLSVD